MPGQEFQKDPMTFASLVAHQMQSPLAAISQALQTLLADYAGPLSPRQRDTLEQASQRCEQAVTSVRRMLAILKATQAPQAPAEPSSVMAVVRQVQGQYLDEAARHDLSAAWMQASARSPSRSRNRSRSASSSKRRFLSR